MASRNRSKDIADIKNNIKKLRDLRTSVLNEIMIRHLQYHLRELEQKQAYHDKRHQRLAAAVAGGVIAHAFDRWHTRHMVNKRLKERAAKPRQ